MWVEWVISAAGAPTWEPYKHISDCSHTIKGCCNRSMPDPYGKSWINCVQPGWTLNPPSTNWSGSKPSCNINLGSAGVYHYSPHCQPTCTSRIPSIGCWIKPCHQMRNRHFGKRYYTLKANPSWNTSHYNRDLRRSMFFVGKPIPPSVNGRIATKLRGDREPPRWGCQQMMSLSMPFSKFFVFPSMSWNIATHIWGSV